MQTRLFAHNDIRQNIKNTLYSICQSTETNHFLCILGQITMPSCSNRGTNKTFGSIYRSEPFIVITISLDTTMHKKQKTTKSRRIDDSNTRREADDGSVRRRSHTVMYGIGLGNEPWITPKRARERLNGARSPRTTGTKWKTCQVKTMHPRRRTFRHKHN